MSIRTILIVNRPLTLQAMKRCLEKDPGIEVADVARGPEDLLESILAARPDVVILDVEAVLPDRDPVTLVVNTRRARPSTEVIALLDHDDVALMRGFKSAEARGCLVRTDDELLALDEVVRRVRTGEVVYSQEAQQASFGELAFRLTPRERAVFRMAARGMTNRAIAEEMNAAVSTIASRLSSVYDKLGASRGPGWNTRVIALKKARRLGLL